MKITSEQALDLIQKAALSNGFTTEDLGRLIPIIKDAVEQGTSTTKKDAGSTQSDYYVPPKYRPEPLTRNPKLGEFIIEEELFLYRPELSPVYSNLSENITETYNTTNDTRTSSRNIL